MSERVAISKRTRFEIFKRDAFTCQYCGAHPPQVILHVDHILAVAEGGGSESDNLITACLECNLGKGAKSLGLIPQPLGEKAKETAEREEQVAGYQAIMAAKRARLDADATEVTAVYERFVPGYTLNESGLISVRRFIESLGKDVVVDAMEIACNRMAWKDHRIFRYFCGVCWKRIRGDE